MNKNRENKSAKNPLVPLHINYLFRIFLSGMVLFMLFRLLLLNLNSGQAEGISASVIFYALFNRGCLFDAAVNSYALIIPFLFLSIGYFIPSTKKVFSFLAFYFLVIFYAFAIAVHSADIPYFEYFNSRLTNGILSWTEDLWIMVKSRFSTPVYYPFIGLFVVVAILFVFLMKRMANKTILGLKYYNEPVLKKILFTAAAGFFLILGARGEIRKDIMPLGIANSFFSNFSFSNQLGLNPVYSFFSSYKDKKLSYLNDEDAVKNVQKYLNITKKYSSPIARDVFFSSETTKPNVVVFLVESLSAFKLKRYGYPQNIMPFIDSLMNVSATFDNVYTDGMHTHNGLYSALFGMPSVLKYKAMSSPLTAGQKHSGLSNVLNEYGYKSVFFCSGDKGFDNMNGFFLNNEFESIISYENYTEKGETMEWGVHDNVMFDYGLKKMDTLASSGKPFLSVMLTVSTHEALLPPEKVAFKPDAEDSYDRCYQYTDWAFSEFFRKAKNTSWFDNTVFVFVGDHGQNFDKTYELPLSYHHVPMIFYSPKLIKPQAYDKIGLQLDLFPTLMDFISLSYINNTLGIDLLKEDRPFAYFSADNKIGCLNNDFFLILRGNGPETLYKYKNNDVTNYMSENSKLALEMKTYVYSMLQTSTFMAVNKYLGLPGK
ncbi:MAG: sulfatase-like hydrolase/transferase [Ignavibacteria bacterium]|nr:sulfatase-like hydrolase/transferase [Ignavibacteria bacterium]